MPPSYTAEPFNIAYVNTTVETTDLKHVNSVKQKAINETNAVEKNYQMTK